MKRRPAEPPELIVRAALRRAVANGYGPALMAMTPDQVATDLCTYDPECELLTQQDVLEEATRWHAKMRNDLKTTTTLE